MSLTFPSCNISSSNMICSTLLYGALVLKLKAHPAQLTHDNQIRKDIMLNHEIV